jgi:uncharacterized protein YtpQ (UPF0354 family)
MRRMGVLLVCVLGLLTVAHAKTLSPREFAAEFAKALSATLPSATLAFKGDFEITVKLADGKETTAYLDNAYKTYTQDPSRLEDVVRTYVSSVSALIEARQSEAALDRSRIVPIIKNRSWLDGVRKTVEARGKTPPEHVFDDFNSKLIVVYAEDGAKGIRYFSRQEFDQAGIERAGLRGLAVDNLKRIIPKIEAQRAPAITMLTAGGDYEASLLLFDNIWSSGQIKVDGDIVVAVPSRDALFVVGSRDLEAVAKLRVVAAKILKESPYGISDALFVYRNGRFTTLEPQ